MLVYQAGYLQKIQSKMCCHRHFMMMVVSTVQWSSFYLGMETKRMSFSMGDLQDPKMEVPIPYIRPIFQAYVSEYPHKIWSYMLITNVPSF